MKLNDKVRLNFVGRQAYCRFSREHSIQYYRTYFAAYIEYFFLEGYVDSIRGNLAFVRYPHCKHYPLIPQKYLELVSQ
jgi:hypothetical protein